MGKAFTVLPGRAADTDMKPREGVLLTTSTFSKEAHEYVTRIERKIVLIDGRRLAQLMIDHDIGVATARSFVVKKVDLDYFDEDG